MPPGNGGERRRSSYLRSRGYLITGSGAYLLGVGLQGLVPLALIPLQVRVLGLEGYGQTVLLASLATLVGMATSIGVPEAVLRVYIGDSDSRVAAPEPRPGLAKGLLKIGWALAALTLILGAMAGLLIGGLTTPRAGAAAGYLGSALLASSVGLSLGVQQYAKASRRPWWFLVAMGSQVLVAPGAATIATRASGDVDLFMLVWGLTACTLAAILSGATVVGFDRGAPADLDRAALRSAIRIGLPILGHSIADVSANTAIRWIVAAGAGAAAVGLLQAAVTIGLAGSIVLSAVNNAWAPFSYSRSETDRSAGEGGEALLVLGLAAGLAAITALVAPTLGQLLVGDNSAEVSSAAVLLAFTSIAQAYYIFGLNHLYWSRRTSTIASVTFITLALQILLTLALVPSLGMFGAAIPIVVTYATQAVVIYRLGARHGGIQLPRRWALAATATWLAAGLLALGL